MAQLEASYPLTLVKEYLVFCKDNEYVLLDTGAMVTVVEKGCEVFELCGRSFKAHDPAIIEQRLGISISSLRLLVGCDRLNVLLGVDILSEFNVQIDFANSSVTFSTRKIEAVEPVESSESSSSSSSSISTSSRISTTSSSNSSSSSCCCCCCSSVIGSITGAENNSTITLPLFLSRKLAIIQFYYQTSAEPKQTELADMTSKELIEMIDLLKIDRTGLSERSELLEVLEANSSSKVFMRLPGFELGFAVFDTGAPNALWTKDRSHEIFPTDSTATEFKIGYNDNRPFETVLHRRPCKLSLEPSRDAEVDVNFWTFKLEEKNSDDVKCPNEGCGATLEFGSANPYTSLPTWKPSDEVHCDLCFANRNPVTPLPSAINCSEGFYHCFGCNNYDLCSKHNKIAHDHRAEVYQQLKLGLGRPIDAVIGMAIMKSRLVTLNWNANVESKHISLSPELKK